MHHGFLYRLFFADNTRRSRFHTSNGKFSFHLGDLLNSALTSVNRICTGRLQEVPWIAMPAVRFLEARIKGLRVFEFGGGMSTVWYAKRALSVKTVENNRAWFGILRKKTVGRTNVDLVLIENEEDYCKSLSLETSKYDVVVIDGSHRRKCLQNNQVALQDAKYVIVDNTDADLELSKMVDLLFSDRTILTFVGYPPGVFHPTECKIVVPK
jgi:hypothetical protein